MKKVMKGALLGVGIVLGTNALAFQGSGWLEIKQINSREGEYHGVMVDGLPEGQGCTHNDRVIIDPTSPGAKEMFDTALLAFVLGKRISVLIEGCVDMHPSQAHPSIDKMDLTAPKALRITMHKDQ